MTAPDFSVIEATVLQLGPNDRLVFRVPDEWDDDKAGFVADFVFELWPELAPRVLFMPKSIEVTVVADGE